MHLSKHEMSCRQRTTMACKQEMKSTGRTIFIRITCRLRSFCFRRASAPLRYTSFICSTMSRSTVTELQVRSHVSWTSMLVYRDAWHVYCSYLVLFWHHTSSSSAVAYICRKIWWVRVSQVKPSNCFRLHPTSMLSKHSTSRFLIASRHLEKLVLIFISDTNLSSLMMWNLQSYPTTLKNVTF